jgi:hypothetical protein
MRHARILLRALAPLVGSLSACGGAQAVPSEATEAAPTSLVAEPFVAFVSPAPAFATATVSVGVVAPPGAALTDGFPFALDVTGPPGAELAQESFGRRDAAQLDGESITFDVPCALGGPGDYAFSATLRYSVCTPTRCVPGSAELSWVLTAH